jgi:hypothetical protein
VAGQHRDIVAERKQFLPDPVYEQIDISARQIASADAAGKKNVAANQQFVGARKETETARTMAGNVQNLKFCAEKISVWRFFDQKIRFHWFDLEFEPKIAKKFAIRNHRCSEWVTPNRTTKLALDPGNVLDVINVSVCKEQKFEINTKRTHPFASTLRRVEENHPFWRLNEITIRFENTATKTLVIHCDLLYPSAITAEGESFYELLNVHPFRLSDPTHMTGLFHHLAFHPEICQGGKPRNY